MPETTPEFHYLALALATARKIIQDLPDHQIRDDLDELKLKSYVLLQHAAIEEYLEKVSLYVLNHCMNYFDQTATITEPLIAVCTYYELNMATQLTCSNKSLKKKDVFGKLCKKAIIKHLSAIDGVHGIKTKDQDSILNPVGIKLHDIDHVLSQMLNSLGENRGTVAHIFRIRQRLPKVALESRTQTLLRLLQSFDNEICQRMTTVYS